MTLDSGEQVSNPLFVNYADTNFHLMAGSPAIGAGLSLGYALDFYSAAVPAAPSLGAVQFVRNAVLPRAASRRVAATLPDHLLFLGRSRFYVSGDHGTAAYTLSGRKAPPGAIKSKMPLAP